MRRILFVLVLFAALVAGGLALTWPRPLPDDAMAGLSGDADRGEAVYHASGCASCHMRPGADEEGGDAVLYLSGGHRFDSVYGTFYAPNISPDPEHGIGTWSPVQLASAMQRGVSPEGAHYYPAFPYTSYAKATLQDIADLHAFLMTLPPDTTPNIAHDIPFPANIRLSLGGWKLLFFRSDWVVKGNLTEQEIRGRYLVEALGHCGECHTPRNFIGGMQFDRWLAGGPDPEGKGIVPNLTPGGLKWSSSDIAYYMRAGFTPDYDSVGGAMIHVVDNYSNLSNADRDAVAAYLKLLPALK
jgi:mono/diheme cytochrome c family protein